MMCNRLFLNVIGVLLSLLGPLCVSAQKMEDRVDEYIRKVAEGRYADIRTDVTTPGAGHRRDDPGMIYLEGLIAPDGTTAIRMFRIVADSLGDNPWRDDALARMFEVYSRMNDRSGASGVLRTLRADHPGTPYLTTGYLGKVAREEEGAAPRIDSASRIVAVYAIQVGAFSLIENAVKLAELLKSKGFNAVIYDNLLDGKNLLHLVWVGRYDKPEDAMPQIRKIEELTGISGVLREQMIWRRW